MFGDSNTVIIHSMCDYYNKGTLHYGSLENGGN